MRILGQARRLPAAEVFRRNGISEQTFYRGKAIGERKQRIGRTQAEVAEG